MVCGFNTNDLLDSCETRQLLQSAVLVAVANALVVTMLARDGGAFGLCIAIRHNGDVDQLGQVRAGDYLRQLVCVESHATGAVGFGVGLDVHYFA